MPRLGFYLIFEIGSSEDRRRLPTRWGLESSGSRGIGPNNHVNCFGHSDLPTGRNGCFPALHGSPSFPVRWENTGKKPGFGPNARKNIHFDQALAGPIP
jgi:hypothetical protein